MGTSRRGRLLRLSPWLAMALPLLCCAAFAVLQSLQQWPARLGDDWIYFHEFDDLALLDSDGGGALTKNGRPEDGLRFRPFSYLWLFVERRLTQSFAVSHAIGLAWIGLGGTALVAFLRAIGVTSSRACLAALLFVLHPAQVEVWGWASARIDTMAMAASFAGLALLAGVAGPLRLVLAYFAFAAAFGSKEAAYPVVAVAPLVPLLRGLGARRALRDAVVACLALGSVLGLKLLLLGSAFAGSWGLALATIPLRMHVAGWFSYLHALLVDPRSTAAPAGQVASALWFGLMVVAIATPFAVLATTTRHQKRRLLRRMSAQTPLYALCIVGFFLTITVSFGVPARGDLAGSRLWYLPSAFLCAAIAMHATRVVLVAGIVVGAFLLDQNLAPYREAGRLMTRVEATIEGELSDAGRALRVADLPKEHGPVPLFVLMAELWTVGRPELADDSTASGPPSFPRVFLSWSEAGQARDLGPVEAIWATEMQRRGLEIRRLVWQGGDLVEATSKR